MELGHENVLCWLFGIFALGLPPTAHPRKRKIREEKVPISISTRCMP
jgi:hypothetical protein